VNERRGGDYPVGNRLHGAAGHDLADRRNEAPHAAAEFGVPFCLSTINESLISARPDRAGCGLILPGKLAPGQGDCCQNRLCRRYAAHRYPMPQAFRPHTVLLLKAGALLAVGLLIGVTILLRWAITPASALNEPVPQPIPFSHKHHVGDDGIDCRFCHNSVERSSFAGLPSSQTCLTCHSQLFRDEPVFAPLHASASSGKPLRWTRVHDLPDFVYFDHRIHISKGVACLNCHGRVDQMPLMKREATLDMQWCLACHRSDTHHIGPLDRVFAMDPGAPLTAEEQQRLQRLLHINSQRRLTDCSTCHR